MARSNDVDELLSMADQIEALARLRGRHPGTDGRGDYTALNAIIAKLRHRYFTLMKRLAADG
jgi:hypothetical protein